MVWPTEYDGSSKEVVWSDDFWFFSCSVFFLFVFFPWSSFYCILNILHSIRCISVCVCVCRVYTYSSFICHLPFSVSPLFPPSFFVLFFFQIILFAIFFTFLIMFHSRFCVHSLHIRYSRVHWHLCLFISLCTHLIIVIQC